VYFFLCLVCALFVPNLASCPCLVLLVIAAHDLRAASKSLSLCSWIAIGVRSAIASSEQEPVREGDNASNPTLTLALTLSDSISDLVSFATSRGGLRSQPYGLLTSIYFDCVEGHSFSLYL
jgi:hypothetical protein